MRTSSKVLILSQFVSSLVIVALVSHAGSYDRPGVGVSPSAMVLLLLATAHTFLTFFIFITALHTDKIYETPLICMHGLLFFVLLSASGAVSIVKSVRFESLEEKEIGIAGGIAVFTALTSIVGCSFSYNLCENLKTL